MANLDTQNCSCISAHVIGGYCILPYKMYLLVSYLVFEVIVYDVSCVSSKDKRLGTYRERGSSVLWSTG